MPRIAERSGRVGRIVLLVGKSLRPRGNCLVVAAGEAHCSGSFVVLGGRGLLALQDRLPMS